MVNLDRLQELNKWWTKGSEFQLDDVDLIRYNSSFMPIIRNSLQPLLKPGKILIVKGPRRAGKTIALKLAVMDLLTTTKVNQDDILYFSFDEAITPKDMDGLIRNFLNKPHFGTTYVFLDEIQSVKGWANIILGLSNSGILNDTAVVVTGSIAHFFGAETLPGRGTEDNIYYLRTATFRTFALSFLNRIKGNAWIGEQFTGYKFTNNEVTQLIDTITKNKMSPEGSIDDMYEYLLPLERYFRPLSKMFDIYMRTGGYPLNISNYFSNPNMVISAGYEEIYNYIKNDAATITSAVSGDPLKAGQTVSGILNYIGDKVSYSTIAGAMAMNKSTLINYFGRLENSFVFLNIKGIKKTKDGLKDSEVKKFYFSDVFMHYAAGAAQTGKPGDVYYKEMANSSRVGIIAEEIVAGHLVRAKERDPMKLYGTYLKFCDEPREIDFVYKREDDTYLGVEVKYQNSASTQDIKTVKGINDYILLTKATDISKRGNCLMLPICIFLIALQSSDRNL